MTILLKLHLLSMCNLQGVGTGGEESVRQAIWFCYPFGFHFHASKFGIVITQHLQWEDTGWTKASHFPLYFFRVLCISIENSFLSCFPLCFC